MFGAVTNRQRMELSCFCDTMQVVTELKTEQDPNCSEPDAEGVSPPPVESQTPMDVDKQAIYR
ncbi:Homeobox protein pknox1 [Saguinus oedipus]|uniref:Homeobox protein pknox1 n=1 Tax=Saguinus oedipus TaxID=9490 RepID=A0ABQ9TZ74_SAGOE|nr:Homeobox protein pknox1 [Saguinus oedipus]